MFNKSSFTPFALFVLFAASSGGILFGYHTAILSGILSILKSELKLSVFDEGVLVSIVLLGGLVGALIAGVAADKWGRKKVLLATAVLFCVGALIQALAHSYLMLLSGRFLAGIAVGLSSVVSPMYLAEIAPPDHRGGFVSSYQFMVAAGILLAYAMNMLFGTQASWPLVFYIALIPSLLQLCTLFFVDETPAWLLRHAQKTSAVEALAHVRKDNEWRENLTDIQQTAVSSTRMDLHLKHLIVIGLLLSIFQQITGVNTVFYYAPNVLVQSGTISASHSLAATFMIGFINLVFTLISILFLDKLGRRVFLLAGVSCMLIGQILLTLSFTSKATGVVGVLAYVIGFAIGLGPITWVLLSEIYPLKIRAKAIGAALFANWLANYIITLTFLFFLKKLGISGTFGMYGFISLLCLLFIYFYIPETKGKSLEEIEHLVKDGKI